MALQTINNSESGSSVRGKLNAMFSELYSDVASVLLSRSTVSPESSSIDFSDGVYGAPVLEMTLTQNRTIDIDGIPGNETGILILNGDYEVDWDGAYSTHLILDVVKRNDVRYVKIMNIGTTGSPIYLIGDLLSGYEVFIVSLTALDEDNSLGVKEEIFMPFPFYVETFYVDQRVAAAEGGANERLKIQVLKNTVDTLTNVIELDDGERDNTDPANPHSFVNDAARNYAFGDRMAFEIEEIGDGTAGQGTKVIVVGYRKGS